MRLEEAQPCLQRALLGCAHLLVAEKTLLFFGSLHTRRWLCLGFRRDGCLRRRFALAIGKRRISVGAARGEFAIPDRTFTFFHVVVVLALHCVAIDHDCRGAHLALARDYVGGSQPIHVGAGRH